MIEAATENIVSMFKLIDACRWVELGNYFHPEIQYIRPGYEPIRGLAELTDFYCQKRIIESGQHTIELICEADAQHAVCATGSFAGIDRSGNAVQVRFCDVYHFEAGKIRRRETFFNSPAI